MNMRLRNFPHVDLTWGTKCCNYWISGSDHYFISVLAYSQGRLFFWTLVRKNAAFSAAAQKLSLRVQRLMTGGLLITLQNGALRPNTCPSLSKFHSENQGTLLLRRCHHGNGHKRVIHNTNHSGYFWLQFPNKWRALAITWHNDCTHLSNLHKLMQVSLRRVRMLELCCHVVSWIISNH